MFDKILIITILLISLASCATRQQIESQKKATKSIQPGDLDFKKDYTIRPGEVVKIQFPYFFGHLKGTLFCDEKKNPFQVNNKQVVAYVAETYFSDLESFSCFYQVNNQKIDVARFNVLPKEFPSERLYVDMKRVELSKSDQQRVEREQLFLNKNYDSSPARPFFETDFNVPLDSYITSLYGARRVFNENKQSQHLGTDFRAATGVEIPASNAGRVVVARDLFYTGLTVTIDHGLGIFTIYGHLSELRAIEGEYVPKGAIIGLSGATGRVTGPHLHWGVRVNGHFIDGLSLVEASQQGQ